ncbi:MFS transporter [Deinococcus irradiatisoli]|uniref:MFS transporter n=1 Tax=Deinococcus irradiatisoli TaxID=2202254 RepID=A0A2Z3JG52_9DEIO|nr:MFS transporter [Deinococcus irradiatisoli]AWN22956.1 MFS transporter [Deinococcus irradiatisoli]
MSLLPQSRRLPANAAALFTVGFLAFLLLGLAQAGYGPAFVRFEQQFKVSTAAVAGISSAHFFGSALGPVVLGALLLRWPLRASVMAGSAVFALGLLGLVFAPIWPLALAAAFFVGLGFGALSGGFNAAFATLGAGPSSLINAMFGIGAVAAPLLALGLGAYPGPFVLTAVLALGLTVSLRSVRVWPAQRAELAASPVAWRRVGLFALLFFTYVGIEAGLGSWAPTHLKQIGNAHPEVVTSAYWLALTAGRLGFAAFGSRLTPHRVVLSCVGLALLGLALLAVPALVVAGYLMVGVAAAPVFPTLLAWFAARFPARVSPLMLTAGSLGGAVIPALIGVLVARFGVQAIPLAVAIDAAALGALALVARRKLGGR